MNYELCIVHYDEVYSASEMLRILKKVLTLQCVTIIGSIAI